jgi:hypothetical protein
VALRQRIIVGRHLNSLVEQHDMPDANHWRRWFGGALAGTGLALGAAAFAADPLPYAVSITPTGDPRLDQAIADASLLAGLRERAPVGPFALLTRAESDSARFDRVLRSFGYYDAVIQTSIAGRSSDDPALLPMLEDLPPTPVVTVTATIDPGPLYRLGKVRLEGAVPADARSAFRLTPGEPALAAAVLDAGAAVLDALKEDGFALASVPPPKGRRTPCSSAQPSMPCRFGPARAAWSTWTPGPRPGCGFPPTCRTSRPSAPWPVSRWPAAQASVCRAPRTTRSGSTRPVNWRCPRAQDRHRRCQGCINT